jgi:glycerophosphoryl diester phosphodiesterase
MTRVTEVVAHRGSSADVPEHTLAAYVQAVADGADALECDVRLTADGHLVCVHDRRIDRTSDGTGVVSVMTLEDLHRVDFGRWRDAGDPRPAVRPLLRPTLRPGLRQPQRLTTQQTLLPALQPAQWLSQRLTLPPTLRTGRRAGSHAPVVDREPVDDDPLVIDEDRSRVLTLERLLELVVDSEREIGLAIETKHPTRYGALVEESAVALLRRFGLARPRSEQDSRVRVMSFSQLSMRRVRAMAPGLPTVFLMDRVPLRFRDGSLPFRSGIAGPSIEIVREHPRYVERVHRAGGQVHVWTVDEPADVALCRELGVDAIITNRPGAVLAQLGRAQNPRAHG